MQHPVQLTKGEELFESSYPIYVNRVSESFDLQLHRHDFIEISYVAQGAGFQYIDQTTLSVHKGDLFYLPIGTSHVFRPATAKPNQPLVVFNCIFTKDALQQLSEKLKFQPTSSAEWKQYKEKQDEFSHLFEGMHHEYVRKKPHYQSMIMAYLSQLLIALDRIENQHSLLLSHPKKSAHLDAALVFLEGNYNQPLTLMTMAAQYGLSERQFMRQFKQATGQTFTQYMQRLRIQHSCAMLRDSSRKVSDIASDVGYQDIKFFHALFKKITGITPGRYRSSYIR